MATKERKTTALNYAIKIAEAFAQGGASNHSPGYVLKETYEVLVELFDEVDKG